MYIYLDKEKKKYPANVIINQKYNVITFIPIVLFQQVSQTFYFTAYTTFFFTKTILVCHLFQHVLLTCCFITIRTCFKNW